MKKRRLCIFLIAACLVILISLTIAKLYKNPPLCYYTQFSLSPKELPTRLIRRAFRIVTNHELPQRADGLRAIFHGGREPAIFVRFQTDSDGIAYICEVFGKTAMKAETFNADFLKVLTASNVSIFPIPSRWQDEIGVYIFEQELIKTGREFRYIPVPGTGTSEKPGYRVLIDDEHNTVYIHSWFSW